MKTIKTRPAAPKSNPSLRALACGAVDTSGKSWPAGTLLTLMSAGAGGQTVVIGGQRVNFK